MFRETTILGLNMILHKNIFRPKTCCDSAAIFRPKYDSVKCPCNMLSVTHISAFIIIIILIITRNSARRAQPPSGQLEPIAPAVSTTWRHRARDHCICHIPFPIGGYWNLASASNRFRDIRPQHMFTNTRAHERTNKHDGSQYLLAEIIIVNITIIVVVVIMSKE